MRSHLSRSLLAIVGTALVSLSQEPAQAGPAEAWQTIPLAEAGFADDLGARLDAAVADGKLAGLHAVLVVRRGKLALERYYNGEKGLFTRRLLDRSGADSIRRKYQDDADFRRADFQRCAFAPLTAMDACFDGCRFDDAEIYDVLASGASFRAASFRGARFRGATLESCDFRLANLSDAAFVSNNLGGKCSIRGADLSTAKLDRAVFDACLFNSKTLFPPGFDPEREGLARGGG